MSLRKLITYDSILEIDALLVSNDERVTVPLRAVLEELAVVAQCETEIFATVKQISGHSFPLVIADCAWEEDLRLLAKTHVVLLTGDAMLKVPM